MSAVSSSAAIGLRYDFNGGKKHIYFPNTDPRQLEEFGFAIRNKQKYLLKKIDLKVRRVTPPTSLRPSDIVAFERGWKNNDATFKQRQVRSANEAVQQQWRNSRDSEERERLASKLQKMMEEEDRFWETYLGYVSWSWRMRAGDPIANVVFFPFPPWPGHRDPPVDRRPIPNPSLQHARIVSNSKVHPMSDRVLQRLMPRSASNIASQTSPSLNTSPARPQQPMPSLSGATSLALPKGPIAASQVSLPPSKGHAASRSLERIDIPAPWSEQHTSNLLRAFLSSTKLNSKVVSTSTTGGVPSQQAQWVLVPCDFLVSLLSNQPDTIIELANKTVLVPLQPRVDGSSPIRSMPDMKDNTNAPQAKMTNQPDTVVDPANKTVLAPLRPQVNSSSPVRSTPNMTNNTNASQTEITDPSHPDYIWW